jgi:hypothetical protein
MFVNLEYPSSDKNIDIDIDIYIYILNTQKRNVIFVLKRKEKTNPSKYTKILVNAQ